MTIKEIRVKITETIVNIIRKEIDSQEETSADLVISEDTSFKKNLKMDLECLKNIIQKIGTKFGVNLSRFDTNEIQTVKDLATLVIVRADQQNINLEEMLEKR